MEEIQLYIMKGLVKNKDFCTKVEPFLKDAYFSGPFKIFYKMFTEFYTEYGTQPDEAPFKIRMNRSKLNQSDFDEMNILVGLVFDNDNDIESIYNTEWLVAECEQFCRDVAMDHAVMESFSILSGDNKKVSRDAIPDLMQEALAISFTSDLGSDYFKTAESRWEEYNNPMKLIPYGLHALNVLTNGGIKKKTLNAILAATNVGKSALMCYLAGEWLKAGYNVVYFSFEMDELEIQQRIDGNLIGAELDKLKDVPKEEFLSRVNSVQAKTNGRFVVKQFPTSSAHAGHMKHFLKELEGREGFKPDIVIGDYINISACRRFPKAEGYERVKSIAEEWRGLAVEMDFAFLTATQVNREGSKKDVVDMDSTSESFGLPMTLDTFIAVTSPKELASRNEQIMSILKSRQGDKSKVKPQKVIVDFAHMRYIGCDEPNQTQRDPVLVDQQKKTAAKTSNRLEELVKNGTIKW